MLKDRGEDAVRTDAGLWRKQGEMSIETYREKADWEGENSDEEEDEEGEDVSPRVSESGSVRAIFVFRHWWRESRSIDAEEDRVRKKAEEREREEDGGDFVRDC